MTWQIDEAFARAHAAALRNLGSKALLSGMDALSSKDEQRFSELRADLEAVAGEFERKVGPAEIDFDPQAAAEHRLARAAQEKAELLTLLAEARNSRATDYANAAYPGWVGRADAAIAKARGDAA